MICLHHGTGIIAAGIRFQTWGKYAHASWLCPDGTVFESHASCGVAHVSNPWVNNDGPVDVYALRNLTTEQLVHIQNFLVRRIGAGYDWMGCVRFLDHVNRNNMARWFCSELVAEACELAGRPLLNTDAFRISPAALSWSTELVPVQMNADRAWWNARFNGNRPCQMGNLK